LSNITPIQEVKITGKVIPYFERTVLSFFKGFFILITIFSLVEIIAGAYSTAYIIQFAAIMYVISFMYCMVYNSTSLYSVTFKNDQVLVSIISFSQIKNLPPLKITDTRVVLSRNYLTFNNRWQITIYSGKKIIARQNETTRWSVAMLTEIKNLHKKAMIASKKP